MRTRYQFGILNLTAMKLNMKKLSIIIISYNTSEIICNCIKSLYSHIIIPIEIIVVDNNSKDDTLLKISELFPDVIVIKNSENLFFARANNQGLKIASGEYILLLNSDTLVIDDSIEMMVNWMDNNLNNGIVCVGPRIHNADMTVQSEGSFLPSLTAAFFFIFRFHQIPIIKNILKGIVPKGMPRYRTGEVRQVGWISGCCMLFCRKVLKEIGGLNEQLEFYGEEVEIGHRLKQLKYKIFVLPQLKIIHFGGMSHYKSDTKKEIKNFLLLQKLTVGYLHSFCIGFIVLLYRLILLFIAILVPKLSIKKCSIFFWKQLAHQYYLLGKLVEIRK